MNLDLRCDECDKDVDAKILNGFVYVKPCNSCMDERFIEGEKQDYDQAEKDIREEGDK